MFKDLPPKDEMLVQIGDQPDKALNPNAFEVLVWNVYKAYCENEKASGCDTKNWSDDFIHITKQSHIILTQESVLSPIMYEVFEVLSNFQWNFAISFFQDNKHPTGVNTATSTGSKNKPIALRSPDKEGGFTTPKTIMVVYHKIAGQKEELMSVNIHAINVHTLSAFKRHIKQTQDLIKQHNGPIFFAGDFNTHVKSRLKFLNKYFIQKLGFTKVPFKHEKDLTVYLKGKKVGILDHAYVRGLQVIDSQVFGENCKSCNISSSDHKPFKVRLKLKP